MLGHWVTESGLGGGRVGPGGVTASWWAAVGVQVVACGNLLKFWTQNLRWGMGEKESYLLRKLSIFCLEMVYSKEEEEEEEEEQEQEEEQKEQEQDFLPVGITCQLTQYRYRCYLESLLKDSSHGATRKVTCIAEKTVGQVQLIPSLICQEKNTHYLPALIRSPLVSLTVKRHRISCSG